MKQVKLTLVGVIALVIGVLTVSFKAVDAVVSVQQPNLYWFNTNAAGTALAESSIPNVAQPQATNRTGCPSSTGDEICGRGYTEAQTDLVGSQRTLKSSTNVTDGTPVRRFID